MKSIVSKMKSDGIGVHKRQTMRATRSVAAIISLALVLVAGGAVAAPPSWAKGSSAKNTLRQLLPSAVEKSGILSAAMEIDYPPDQFYKGDTKTVTGYNADFTRAIASLLGLKPEFINVNFDGIVAGLDANRYDIGPSGYYDTAEREKNGTFVDYMQTGNTILVAKGNPKHITSIDDFCGMTIAQDVGEAMIAQEQSLSKSYCLAHGKSAIKVDQFTNVGDQMSAIATGRADATLETFDTNAYNVKLHPSTYEVVGPYYKGPLWGIALAKGQTKLAKAVAAAIDEMIKDGTYAKILKEWGIQKAALPEAEIDRSAYVPPSGL